MVCFAQAEGYLQVIDNRALLLVEEAHESGSLDAGELRERLAQAERELEEAGDDSERRRVAVRDRNRWETFLKIARGLTTGWRLIAASSGIPNLSRLMVDEHILAERLIRYETSGSEDLVAAAGFVKVGSNPGHRGARLRSQRPAGAGGRDRSRDAEAPCVVFHGHLDVVPGRPEQFEPRIEGDRLIGRGAFDMKGGLAAMMCALKDVENQNQVRVS